MSSPEERPPPTDQAERRVPTLRPFTGQWGGALQMSLTMAPVGSTLGEAALKSLIGKQRGAAQGGIGGGRGGGVVLPQPHILPSIKALSAVSKHQPPLGGHRPPPRPPPPPPAPAPSHPVKTARSITASLAPSTGNGCASDEDFGGKKEKPRICVRSREQLSDGGAELQGEVGRGSSSSEEEEEEEEGEEQEEGEESSSGEEQVDWRSGRLRARAAAVAAPPPAAAATGSSRRSFRAIHRPLPRSEDLKRQTKASSRPRTPSSFAPVAPPDPLPLGPPPNGPESTSVPARTAGHALPAEFPKEPPNLAWRAIGVYTCLRTLSSVLALSPFPPLAFLRGLVAMYRNMLLDEAHTSILRLLGRHMKLATAAVGSGDGGSMSAKAKALHWAFLDRDNWPAYFTLYVRARWQRWLFSAGAFENERGGQESEDPRIAMSWDDEVEKRANKLAQQLQAQEYHVLPVEVKVAVLEYLCQRLMDVPEVYAAMEQKGCYHDVHAVERSRFSDGKSAWCLVCRLGGTLVLCDYCPNAFHLRCVRENEKDMPARWLCPECRFFDPSFFGGLVPEHYVRVTFRDDPGRQEEWILRVMHGYVFKQVSTSYKPPPPQLLTPRQAFILLRQLGPDLACRWPFTQLRRPADMFQGSTMQSAVLPPPNASVSLISLDRALLRFEDDPSIPTYTLAEILDVKFCRTETVVDMDALTHLEVPQAEVEEGQGGDDDDKMDTGAEGRGEEGELEDDAQVDDPWAALVHDGKALLDEPDAWLLKTAPDLHSERLKLRADAEVEASNFNPFMYLNKYALAQQLDSRPNAPTVFLPITKATFARRVRPHLELSDLRINKRIRASVKPLPPVARWSFKDRPSFLHLEKAKDMLLQSEMELRGLLEGSWRQGKAVIGDWGRRVYLATTPTELGRLAAMLVEAAHPRAFLAAWHNSRPGLASKTATILKRSTTRPKASSKSRPNSRSEQRLDSASVQSGAAGDDSVEGSGNAASDGGLEQLDLRDLDIDPDWQELPNTSTSCGAVLPATPDDPLEERRHVGEEEEDRGSGDLTTFGLDTTGASVPVDQGDGDLTELSVPEEPGSGVVPSASPISCGQAKVDAAQGVQGMETQGGGTGVKKRGRPPKGRGSVAAEKRVDGDDTASVRTGRKARKAAIKARSKVRAGAEDSDEWLSDDGRSRPRRQGKKVVDDEGEEEVDEEGFEEELALDERKQEQGQAFVAELELDNEQLAMQGVRVFNVRTTGKDGQVEWVKARRVTSSGEAEVMLVGTMTGGRKAHLREERAMLPKPLTRALARNPWSPRHGRLPGVVYPAEAYKLPRVALSYVWAYRARHVRTSSELNQVMRVLDHCLDHDRLKDDEPPKSGVSVKDHRLFGSSEGQGIEYLVATSANKPAKWTHEDYLELSVIKGYRKDVVEEANARAAIQRRQALAKLREELRRLGSEVKSRMQELWRTIRARLETWQLEKRMQPEHAPADPVETLLETDEAKKVLEEGRREFWGCYRQHQDRVLEKQQELWRLLKRPKWWIEVKVRDYRAVNPETQFQHDLAQLKAVLRAKEEARPQAEGRSREPAAPGSPCPPLVQRGPRGVTSPVRSRVWWSMADISEEPLRQVPPPELEVTTRQRDRKPRAPANFRPKRTRTTCDVEAAPGRRSSRRLFRTGRYDGEGEDVPVSSTKGQDGDVGDDSSVEEPSAYRLTTAKPKRPVGQQKAARSSSAAAASEADVPRRKRGRPRKSEAKRQTASVATAAIMTTALEPGCAMELQAFESVAPQALDAADGASPQVRHAAAPSGQLMSSTSGSAFQTMAAAAAAPGIERQIGVCACGRSAPHPSSETSMVLCDACRAAGLKNEAPVMPRQGVRGPRKPRTIEYFHDPESLGPPQRKGRGSQPVLPVGDRTWLERVEDCSLRGPSSPLCPWNYVPQAGDEVAYLRAAHENFLSHNLHLSSGRGASRKPPPFVQLPQMAALVPGSITRVVCELHGCGQAVMILTLALVLQGETKEMELIYVPTPGSPAFLVHKLRYLDQLAAASRGQQMVLGRRVLAWSGQGLASAVVQEVTPRPQEGELWMPLAVLTIAFVEEGGLSSSSRKQTGLRVWDVEGQEMGAEAVPMGLGQEEKGRALAVVDTLIQEYSGVDVARPIVEGISKDEDATYWNRMACCVHLGLIRRRLVSGHYRQLEALLADLDLMYNNLVLYFGEKKRVSKLCLGIVERIRRDIQLPADEGEVDDEEEEEEENKGVDEDSAITEQHPMDVET